MGFLFSGTHFIEDSINVYISLNSVYSSTLVMRFTLSLLKKLKCALILVHLFSSVGEYNFHEKAQTYGCKPGFIVFHLFSCISYIFMYIIYFHKSKKKNFGHTTHVSNLLVLAVF